MQIVGSLMLVVTLWLGAAILVKTDGTINQSWPRAFLRSGLALLIILAIIAWIIVGCYLAFGGFH